ncbi:hypothetical protein KGA66_27700 [Actinocrinis puniceicyclus]|uniref:Mannosyltransferase (PIG-V) n=1 Tax=Actinocrinis puniceicyclus TaxID=977794 RepID=A0A8J7WQV6_9ACTN|nr:mannosyltransferase family protein [Actinocrinis puniceicyclus]MBS2966851.1 hypothetical protein [Actinocrinis puniceicyclus]
METRAAAGARGIRSVRPAWPSRLTATDRSAIGVTIGAHAALAIVAYCSSWIQGTNNSHQPLTGAYQHWDANLYVNYAQHGLFSGQSAPNNAAFLPGYPILLAFVHLFVRNWLDSALLLSLVAGCVAAVLLNRMAGSTRAGLFLFTAPAAVFLTVGYSEPLFLAFAVAAWYAALHAEWSVAQLFAGLAGLTRIDGLALIPALVLFALVRPGSGRRLHAASIAAAAALGPFMYELYLRRATGSWTAWQAANRKGWNLWVDWPWTAIRNTWRGAYEYGDGSGAYAWAFQLELVCTIAAALLVIVLLARRAWPEAAYCALVLASMVFVNSQQAADRGLLMCFPLYVLLARAADRRPWIGNAYLWVSAPIALVSTYLYTAGSWAN